MGKLNTCLGSYLVQLDVGPPSARSGCTFTCSMFDVTNCEDSSSVCTNVSYCPSQSENKRNSRGQAEDNRSEATAQLTSAATVEDKISNLSDTVETVCARSCVTCKLSSGAVCVHPSDLCKRKYDFLLPSSQPTWRINSPKKTCHCKNRPGKDREFEYCCAKRNRDVILEGGSCTNTAPTNNPYLSVQNDTISSGSCYCKVPESYENQLCCVGYSWPSKSENISAIPGAFSLPEVYSDLHANPSRVIRNWMTRGSSPDSSCNRILVSQQGPKFHWKSLLMLALLLPCVFSRENLSPKLGVAKPDTNFSYLDSSDFSNLTIDVTVLPTTQGNSKASSSSQSRGKSSPTPSCKGGGCSKPAALGGEEKTSNGQRSVHMERIKMMLIPIVTVATAAAVLVSIYCICSRSDSIHRLLGGPPRTTSAAGASRSTSFSDSANKNPPGNQGSNGGNSGSKGQTSVSNSRQSSVRSLAMSAHGDSQDVPKGFIPPMRPY
ncbi:hypothetical protein ElyMa_001439000 [Elysia marginata]|uniref:Activin types I and II receptor domain-containing protein n=1 Tax=Elysia marginata TaxID=1093978 RepID=A0AAV4J023_9GAST|nr:hypothetical protein ElyMa_001439000 [Elysia marginata]